LSETDLPFVPLENSISSRSPKVQLNRHRPSLPALTGIRFFAASYVVLYHSHLPDGLEEHHLPALAQLIRNGRLAVPLFFILSGLILSYTYEGQISNFNSYRRFWEARFARVWPLYFASLLFSTVVNHTTPTSISLVVATLFMVQSWNPLNVAIAASWNFVCWTLSVEAFFYALFPPIQKWLERQSIKVILAVLTLMIGVAVVAQTGGISYSDTHGIQYLSLALIHLPEFLIGMTVGNLFLRGEVRRLVSKMPGRGALTLTLAALSLFLLSRSNSALVAWTALTFPLLLFCLSVERSPIQALLSSKIVVVAGQISFGLYLLQWPCKTLTYGICDRLRIDSASARLGLYCTVLILISAAGFYGLEEPARKVIRAFFARKERPVV
jgi:peptidoglycan/LPS O-acetylase OafA/YrhL